MKYILTILIIAIFAFSGCDKQIIPLEATPTPAQNFSTQINPTADLESTPTPEAKITSDFKDAPTLSDVEQVANKKMSAVLLQDMLQYQLPLDKHFSVALQEDAEKGYRWLISGEDGIYEYVEELHVNGYRVFVFMPKSKGETSINFELTQNGSTLIDILSYQLNFS